MRADLGRNRHDRVADNAVQQLIAVPRLAAALLPKSSSLGFRVTDDAMQQLVAVPRLVAALILKPSY